MIEQRMMISIQLNGESFDMPEEAKLVLLVKHLALEGKRYAIEVNGDIVPRGEHDKFSLSADDQVEVVQAIGGG